MSERSRSKYTMRLDSSSPDGPIDASVSPTVAFGSSTPLVSVVGAAALPGAILAAWICNPRRTASEAKSIDETRFFIFTPVVIARMVHGKKGPHTGSRTSPASASRRAEVRPSTETVCNTPWPRSRPAKMSMAPFGREARRFFLAAFRQHLQRAARRGPGRRCGRRHRRA